MTYYNSLLTDIYVLFNQPLYKSICLILYNSIFPETINSFCLTFYNSQLTDAIKALFDWHFTIPFWKTLIIPFWLAFYKINSPFPFNICVPITITHFSLLKCLDRILESPICHFFLMQYLVGTFSLTVNKSPFVMTMKPFYMNIMWSCIFWGPCQISLCPYTCIYPS